MALIRKPVLMTVYVPKQVCK